MEAVLSFLGCVNIAVRLVQEQYPDAQLYDVVGTPAEAWAPVSSPDQLSQLRIVFNTKKDGKQGTVLINSASQWGEFEPPKYVPQPWLQDIVIPWPLTGDYYDPKKADAHLKEKGFTKDYTSMTLRHPVYPGDDQPYYIFHLVDKTWVFVGIKDGSIKTETTEPEPKGQLEKFEQAV